MLSTLASKFQERNASPAEQTNIVLSSEENNNEIFGDFFELLRDYILRPNNRETNDFSSILGQFLKHTIIILLPRAPLAAIMTTCTTRVP